MAASAKTDGERCDGEGDLGGCGDGDLGDKVVTVELGDKSKLRTIRKNDDIDEVVGEEVGDRIGIR